MKLAIGQSINIGIRDLRGPKILSLSPSSNLKSEVVLARSIRRSLQAVDADRLDLIAGKDPKAARLYVRDNTNTPFGYHLIGSGQVSLSAKGLKFDFKRVYDQLPSNRQIVIIPDAYLDHYREEFKVKLAAKKISSDTCDLIKARAKKHPKSPYSRACQKFAKELDESELKHALPPGTNLAVLKLTDKKPVLLCFGKVTKASNSEITFAWERWTQQPGEKESAKALRAGNTKDLVFVPLTYLHRELEAFRAQFHPES